MTTFPKKLSTPNIANTIGDVVTQDTCFTGHPIPPDSPTELRGVKETVNSNLF